MKRAHPPSGLPLGIQKLSEIDALDAEGRNTALAKIFSTREVRQALGNILPDLLRVFAGDKKFKKLIFSLVGRYLNKSLARPTDVFEENELRRLFEDERFLQHLTEPLPDIINGLFDIIATAANTIENLDTDEKKALFKDLVSKTATGRTGEIITRACRILNDIHRDDPKFFAKAIEPGFEKWIQSMDFGEIKEAVENSAQDTRAFVKMVNNVMWQHPAKVVVLLSLLPAMVNMLSEALEISVGRLNELPPDLTTDVILSLINEIDPRPVSKLTNQLTEIVRKVHTGSALIGEPGAPQLPKVLSAKLGELIANIDPVTLWKARIALAETRASLDQAMAEAVNENPAFKQLSLIKGPEISNIRAKALNRKLAWWETLDDTEAARSVSQNLSAYDIQEAAEVVNNLLRLFNRAGAQQPELFVQLFRQVSNAVDHDELAEAARRVFESAGKELQPVTRSVVPGMVCWICDVLKPSDDEYEDEALLARQALASLVATEEA